MNLCDFELIWEYFLWKLFIYDDNEGPDSNFLQNYTSLADRKA